MINDKNNLEYTIQENNKTVKTILKENLEFSSRLLKKLELNNKIFLNNRETKLNKLVFIGDKLSISFEESEDEYKPQDMKLDILYEDDDILALNKPPYVVMHPTRSHQEDTLANGILYYFIENDIKRKVRLVNRLDMNTSGIVLIAKNPFVHNELSKQMSSNLTEKYYYAVVEGIIESDRGKIDAPILRLNEEDIIRIVHKDGKNSITHYEVINRFKNMTLVKLKLETGRTHQIRVHMKHINHPIVGDHLYGMECEIINRQALHCCKMSFIKPFTGTRIEIECDLPDDMLNLMKI